MTLIEVLVTIAVISVLSGIALRHFSLKGSSPDLPQLPARVSAELEAVHTHALATRTGASVLGNDATLTVRTSDGTESLAFPGGTLSGTVNILGDGTPSGALQVRSAAGCELLSLSAAGLVQRGACTP